MKPRIIAVAVIFTVLTLVGVIVLRVQIGQAFDSIETPQSGTAHP